MGLKASNARVQCESSCVFVRNRTCTFSVDVAPCVLDGQCSLRVAKCRKIEILRTVIVKEVADSQYPGFGIGYVSSTSVLP